MSEKRLTFTLSERDCYNITNTSNQLLGVIKRQRVGKFMHWCFLPAPINMLGEMWFTNGCLKEIVEKITELYREGK